MNFRRKSSIVFRQIAALVALAMLVMAAPVAYASGSVGVTTCVSLTSAGGSTNAASASISADGRFVAFLSTSSEIAAGDKNSHADVFVLDRQSGETALVSVASDGVGGDNESASPSISGDGRYVVFHSSATNLVPGDTNGQCDVFAHDRQTGVTSRVSVASDGTEANRRSYAPSISANGRYVAFQSAASNLVPGTTNEARDIFVHDLQTGETTRVSVASDGTEGDNRSQRPSISGDGRYVAFHSSATNLVPDDTNGHSDVFVHDRQTGRTIRVSVASDGTQTRGERGSYHPSISADGKYVAFHSWAPNLVAGDSNRTADVFVHELRRGVTTRVSISSLGAQGNAQSEAPAISADGLFVTFDSDATNLIPNDRNGVGDVFLHDLKSGETNRISEATGGKEGNGHSRLPSISADGRIVAFESAATTIVHKDLDDTTSDIYVHERNAYVDPRVSVARTVPIQRVEGRTRFETAAEAYKVAYPNGLDPAGHRTVVIVSGRMWQFALIASSLAGALDGPVLLTNPNHVPNATMAEIARLGAVKAIVIGCEESVHLTVDRQLEKALGEGNVERICGSSDIDVADRVAARVIALQDGKWDGKAFVVPGGVHYDVPAAFAVAPVASAQSWPIYFVSPEKGLLPKTRAAMYAVKDVVLVGGEECVSSEIEAYFKMMYGPEHVERIADDVECCAAATVAIAEWAMANTEMSWDGVAVMTPDRSGHVLAAGVMQGKAGSFVLFSEKDKLNACAVKALRDNESEIDHVRFVGERPAKRGPEQALHFDGVGYIRSVPALDS